MESSFTPTIWTEEIAPAEAANCKKCELHCQRLRVIWGEGNPSASIIVILDNPGEREDKDGNQYICGTRQTLQMAAFKSGLSMNDLYITYILKCRPLRKYNKEIARKACLSYIDIQLKSKQPQLAICLGNTAVQWFFNNMDLEVKSLRGTWHTARNIPTIVSYHPLAVRRRPNLLNHFMSDWDLLAHRYKAIISAHH